MPIHSIFGQPVVSEVHQVGYSSPPDVTDKPQIAAYQIKNFEAIVSNGIYKSPFQGFELKIPDVAGASKVRIIQSIISSRPDKTPITTDVIFIPLDSQGANAVVVTRMRDDKPKDTESILSQFSPPDEASKLSMEKQGVVYKRIDTIFGTTLQRSIKNSQVSQYFPYKVMIGNSESYSTVGVSRFVLIGEFLCEFVVVADSRHYKDLSQIQSAAEKELDILMASMIKKPQVLRRC